MYSLRKLFLVEYFATNSFKFSNIFSVIFNSALFQEAVEAPEYTEGERTWMASTIGKPRNIYSE